MKKSGCGGTDDRREGVAVPERDRSPVAAAGKEEWVERVPHGMF